MSTRLHYLFRGKITTFFSNLKIFSAEILLIQKISVPLHPLNSQSTLGHVPKAKMMAG